MITLFAAWPIAVIVSGDSPALVWVWILFWAGLYWLWRAWDRRHRNCVSRLAVEPRAAVAIAKSHARLSYPRRLSWRQILSKTAKLVAGAIAVIVLMVGSMIFYLGYCERHAKAERNKVRVGMTVDDVLPVVHGAIGIRAHAVLPDNVTDPDGVHYATFVQHSDHSYGLDGRPSLREDEAIALIKQKMGDGYEWRWRYTFINATPQHFSFTVTFGPDGRVKNVTDVWGWD